MNRVLLSFGFGTHGEYLEIVRPTFEKYAKRHGYDLLIPNEAWFDKYSVRRDYISRPYSWWKIPLLEWCFSIGGYDEALWLDADVAVVNGSVDLFSEVPKEYDCACVIQKGADPYTPCLGVWANRNRPQILELLDSMWQQTQYIHHNWWEQAAFIFMLGLGLHPPRKPETINRFLAKTYVDLDYRWCPHILDYRRTLLQPTIMHATGYHDRAETLRTAVLLSEFSGYDIEKYNYLRDNDNWAIDKRHALCLFSVLAYTDVKSVLEIGAYNGYSTSAIIEAMAVRDDLVFDICDVEIRHTVKKLAERFSDRTRILHKRSFDALRNDGPWDAVWIDGDHTIEVVSGEVRELLKFKPRIVAAHDTAFDCNQVDGPRYLKHMFSTHPDYYCVEDGMSRPGESTNRGLFFATTDLKCLEVIKKIMRSRCTHYGWPGSI